MWGKKYIMSNISNFRAYHAPACPRGSRVGSVRFVLNTEREREREKEREREQREYPCVKI